MNERMFTSNGTMIHNGQTYHIQKFKETTGMNGYTKYKTTLWTDGSLSCTCQGWCVPKRNQIRTCKHCEASIACNYTDMQSENIMNNQQLQLVMMDDGRALLRLETKNGNHSHNEPLCELEFFAIGDKDSFEKLSQFLKYFVPPKHLEVLV